MITRLHSAVSICALMTIAPTARILNRVKLGAGCVIGDFVVLGEWPSDNDPDKPLLQLGDNARIRSHTVLYAGVVAGPGLQTGHGALVREHSILGDNVSIGSHTILEHHVTVGNKVRIHSGAFIPELCVLEDDCWIGPRVVMTNAPHPLCVNLPDCLIGVTVKKGARIGANVTLLPGVVVGENALVGAGAVVVNDVEPGTVVAGVPARALSRIEDLKCPLDGNTSPYGFNDSGTNRRL